MKLDRYLFVALIVLGLVCVAVLFWPSPPTAVTPDSPPVTYEGTGNKVISFQVARSGALVISALQESDGVLAGGLLDSNGEFVTVAINCIDAGCQDETIVNVSPGQYFLEINTRSSWFVVINPP